MRRQRTAFLLIIAWSCGVAVSPASADTNWAFAADPGTRWASESEWTLQLLHEREELFAPLGGDSAQRSAAELRLDFQLRCNAVPCEGTRLILKPRLVADRHDRPAALPDPKPDWLAEGYVLHESGKSVRIGAGKRLMGWGPSLLYSPTNRLFPDNGAVTPRRDIPGKPMVFGSANFSSRGRVTALVADPRLDDVAGIDSDGGFSLARAEWNWVEGQLTTAGAVTGGGGGFRPYVGGYVQHGIGDAWTIGAEVAASRGYADGEADAAGLLQNRQRSRWDGVANLRYGATSGAEIGVELIYNGFALSDEEIRNPLLAAYPSAGRGPSRNRPLHPFVQSQYLLVQGTWPKLFGDRRWGLTTRFLQGLDRSSTSAFSELSFSPGDTSTLYLGVSHSRAGRELEMSQPVTRSIYFAVDAFF
ncbi:hypothetical protein ACNKU7_00960 [Microbulbifer sp. SA54]|uniref:hypothetical protein n=1 Tax=Microbulbifer sp. SA54 TaxID=3401577 RepID=UPI003AAE3F55